jgi:hypothetical protein
LTSAEKTRFYAGTVSRSIDLGYREVPDGKILRHLKTVARSAQFDDDARLPALGNLAEWNLYQSIWPPFRVQKRKVRSAQHLLEIKRVLEERALRKSSGRLLRADGQLASLYSLSGEWERVPAALDRLLELPRGFLLTASGEDRANWRFQAFYAVRWMAFRALLREPVPEPWKIWWSRERRSLLREVQKTGETHLESGLERSILIMEGPRSWTERRQQRLTRFFRRLLVSASAYEHDYLIGWGFAAALAWLAQRWDLPWERNWNPAVSECLGRLEWHGRHRELAQLARTLARQRPRRDSEARCLQAILRAVLY